MVIARLEVKFKHEKVTWKINASVPYVLELELLLPNVFIDMSEVQNQPLLTGTVDGNGQGIDDMRGTGNLIDRA